MTHFFSESIRKMLATLLLSLALFWQ